MATHETAHTEQNPSAQQQTLTIQQALDLAGKHNNAGDLPKAESICRQILQADPNQHVALHLLGVIAQQVGKNEIAEKFITKAIDIKPDYAEAHSNLGAALRELGRLDEAVTHCQKAIDIKPDVAEAHSNLGLALKELGRLDDAVDHYHKAIDIKPDFAVAHSNLGYALLELGSYSRRSEAFDYFKRSMEINRGDNPIDPQHQSFMLISKAKMNHDIEQFRYLASLRRGGHETERFKSLADIYEAVDTEIDWPSDDGMKIPLSDDHRQRLGDTYNRPIHLLEAPEVTGSTLSSNLDIEKITADYFTHSAGMTYFDDLLSPKALASLRRFLLDSTIWFDFSYKGGYLGAILKDGFSCPLLFQIADDLRRTFPDIFKNHKLTQSWAYKYDSSLSGIAVHADFAAINVNFWITPDTANLNPASSGLVVYDVEAPLDWNFKTYNENQNRIHNYLSDHGSGKIVVPYGENRIVLFNSNLFHESDTIDFRLGYENRRINITMLFGLREG